MNAFATSSSPSNSTDHSRRETTNHHEEKGGLANHGKEDVDPRFSYSAAQQAKSDFKKARNGSPRSDHQKANSDFSPPHGRNRKYISVAASRDQGDDDGVRGRNITVEEEADKSRNGVALGVSSSFCNSIAAGSSEGSGDHRGSEISDSSIEYQPPIGGSSYTGIGAKTPGPVSTTRHQNIGDKKFDFGDIDFAIQEDEDDDEELEHKEVPEKGSRDKSPSNSNTCVASPAASRSSNSNQRSHLESIEALSSSPTEGVINVKVAPSSTQRETNCERKTSSTTTDASSSTQLSRSSGSKKPPKRSPTSSPRLFRFVPCSNLCTASSGAIAPRADEPETVARKASDMAASGSPDNMVPTQLQRRIRGVVWDFDKTVLRIHAFAKRISPAHVPKRRLSEDFADLEGFKSVVYQLVKNDIKVGIASFGRHDVIKAYLDRTFPDQTIFTPEDICTPSSLNIDGLRDGCAVPGGKSAQLEQFISRWGIKKEQLVFFDDDYNNVTNLDHEGYKWYFHTPQGFTSLVWAEATKVILGEKKCEEMKEPERDDLETTRQKCSDAFIAENENPSTGGTVKLQAPPTKGNTSREGEAASRDVHMAYSGEPKK
eukprot:gb/GECG01011565.1/.p1 GENE.gb/GECG01011565.1/~~gb/GECG01011565.1/.p1  ORF type:complete len:600 (+),score=97.45 gb/GECG01011565.1/:1-1800(+)